MILYILCSLQGQDTLNDIDMLIYAKTSSRSDPDSFLALYEQEFSSLQFFFFFLVLQGQMPYENWAVFVCFAFHHKNSYEDKRTMPIKTFLVTAGEAGTAIYFMQLHMNFCEVEIKSI